MPGRSPTAVPLRGTRPFLIETHVENFTDLVREPYADCMILRIGAMCDEDVEENLVILVGSQAFSLDRRHLARIWPQLFTLDQAIMVDRLVDVQFRFPGKAVVVVAGVSHH